jgi:hypothetical protein
VNREDKALCNQAYCGNMRAAMEKKGDYEESPTADFWPRTFRVTSNGTAVNADPTLDGFPQLGINHRICTIGPRALLVSRFGVRIPETHVRIILCLVGFFSFRRLK